MNDTLSAEAQLTLVHAKKSPQVEKRLPGDLAMWFFILAEFTVFAILFIGFAVSEQLNTDIVLLQDFFNNKQLDFSSECINPYISSASQDVKDKWQLFINTLQSCQEKNLINGLLVMGMKNYNDKLLGLLTQQNPDTYHPSQPVKKTMSTREHKA